MIGAKPTRISYASREHCVKGLQMLTFSCYITSRYPLPLVSMSSTTHQISLCLFTPLSPFAGKSSVCPKKPP